MLVNATYAWIFSIIIIVLSLIKWYIGRNDDYWKKRGVPYTPRFSYLSMFYMILTKSFADLVRGMPKPARVFGSFEGSVPNINITDPDLLRDILVKDFHIFPYRRIMVLGDPVADRMVTVLTGDDWKRVRTIITPAFTSKRMRQMGSIINESSKSVVEVCDKYNNKKEPVDVKRMFGAFTMDVIAKSAFGTKIDSHNDPNNLFVKKVRDSFLTFTLPRMMFLMLLPGWLIKWIPSSINPMIMDKENFFRDVTRNVIKHRKETGTRYNDFLQILMDAFDERTHNENLEMDDETDRFGSITSNGTMPSAKFKKISEIELLAQSVIFFMAGYETTASVLTFLAYTLAVNPEWQEKLRAEVDEAFKKHDEMSYDAVRDMKVFDAVLSETLRMHPPLLTSERTAVEDYELGNTGILIAKGMGVQIPIYALHFDPEFFEDPDTFHPERFMEGYEPKHPQYAYMPFGAGPRNCLGMRFALLEIKMCMANILRHFRFKRHSTTKVPLEYKKGMILLTVNDLLLMVERRTDVN